MHVPVTTALDIAQMDRARFNEAVARAWYTCAPGTRSRERRLFDEIDIVGVALYRNLVALGFKPDRAGKIACFVVRKEREGKAITEVNLVRSQDGHTWTLGPGEEWHRAQEQICIRVDLSAIRRHVRASLEEIEADEE